MSNKQYDNTNRGAMWARPDGLKAAPGADRTPPVVSGVLDVEGEAYSISLWLANSETSADVEIRRAIVALTKAVGGKLADGQKTGGAPIFKVSINKRDGGGGSGAPRKSAPRDVADLF